MPTLDLFTPATHPDGWRQVRAPGGYESWSFSVISKDERTQVMAGLHLGHPLDASYARRYAWYRAFPTRIAPPVPAEYPSISLVVLHDDQVLWSMLRYERDSEFTAAIDRGKVRIGGSHFETNGDGTLHLGLRGQMRERTVTADLVLRPKVVERCEEVHAGVHRVAIVAPVCAVEGEVNVFDASGEPRVIDVGGIGCHTHRFGTQMSDEPIGVGYALAGDRAVLLHAFGSRVYVSDITAERCRRVELEMENHAAPFAISDGEIQIASARLIDGSHVIGNATIGEAQCKFFGEMIQPKSPPLFLRMFSR